MISDSIQNAWFTLTLNQSLLVAGVNTIAVEVHGASATDNDLRFDAAITDSGAKRFWSVGGVAPAADGAGTWAANGANFYVNSPSQTQAPYDNTSNADVIFGNSGAGGLVTLGGNVRVGGALVLASATTPYAIGAAGGTSSLQLAGGISAGANATINTPIALESSQTFRVSPVKTLHVNGSVSELSPGTSLTKSDAGTLSVASSIVLTGSLNVSGGAMVLSATGAASSVGNLSVNTIAGAKLDLTNGALVVNYTSSSPLAAIRSLLASGRGTGNWTGPGITSSGAATAFGSAHPTALGYAEASAVGITTSFFGQPVDSTSVVLRYTYVGDANLDGTVNALDFNALASGFGKTGGTDWHQADFNYDGTTDTQDFAALAQNFGMTFAAPSQFPGALVPEPAALAAFAIMPVLWFRRRRAARA